MINKIFKTKINPSPDEIANLIREDGKLKGYKQSQNQEEFTREIIKFIGENDKSGATDKVTAIPAPCGIGKSVTLKQFVSWCASNDESAVFVTDSIDRIDSVFDLDKVARRNVFKCEGKMSLRAVKDEMMDKTVVLISTQKYFNLSKEQREILFTYKYRGTVKFRRRVFFDEKPYLFQTFELGISDLNDIDSLIRSALNETVKEKAEIIKMYGQYKERIIKYIETNEKECYEDKICFSNTDELAKYGITYDEQLFRLLKKYRSVLTEYDYDKVRNIDTLKMLCKEGGIFVSFKKSNGYEYSKRFVVYKNNSEYFSADNDTTRFYIFDATSYIDPLYNQKFIIKYDCEKYFKKLNLKIKIVNIPTSKSTLNDESIDKIIKYIQRTKSVDEPLIMVNKRFELNYKKEFKNVAHFGNIKGFNCYNNITECFHIGINRYDNLSYYFMACTQEPRYYNMVKQMTKQQSTTFFNLVFSSQLGFEEGLTKLYEFAPDKDREKYLEFAENVVDAMESAFVDSIIADFEQNIFRMSMRKYDNDELNTAYLLLNTKTYLNGMLIDKIREVYQERAEIEVIDVPNIIAIGKIESRKSRYGETNAQKILNFIKDKAIGEKFTIGDLKNATGLSQRQVNKVKECNPKLKDLLKELRTKRSEYEIKEDVISKYGVELKSKQDQS